MKTMRRICKKFGKIFGTALLCMLAAILSVAAVTFSSCAHTANPPESGWNASSPDASGSASDNTSDESSPEDGAGGDSSAEEVGKTPASGLGAYEPH